MAIQTLYPKIKPSLLLDFANTKRLDSRIAFTRASTATYFDANGVLRTALAGAPRLDHNPVTGESLGLLAEEQRTNLLTYSEQFDNADWNVKTGTQTTSGYTQSPSGVLDATTLTHSAPPLFGRVGVAIATGSTVTYSIFVKRGNTDFVRLRVASGGATLSAWFNLATGVKASNTAGSSPVIFSGHDIRPAANGFYRLSVTVVTSGVSTVDLSQACSLTDGAGAEAGNFAYIWGAQLEEGAFPTSYIKTEASQVTRLADNASMTGANFSSWYRQDEGTFEVFARSSVTSSITIIQTDDGTAANRLAVQTNAGLQVCTSTVTSSDTAFFSPAGAISATAFNNLAFAYKVNDFAGVTNANAQSTGTSGALPAVIVLRIGGNSTASQLNGHIKSLTYYPKRLANTELQAITT